MREANQDSAAARRAVALLAVWWLRPGIRLQRIKPAAFNFLQQQEHFEDFIRVNNQKRLHQALGGLYPAEVYAPSARRYEPPQDPDYPFHDRTVRVTRCGRICLGHRKINLSVALAEQLVGIRSVNHVSGMRRKPCDRNAPPGRA